MRFIGSRVLQLVFVLVAASALTFLIQAALPGDAAQIRVGPMPDATSAQRAAVVQRVREQLGLDKPLPVQFWRWLSSAAKFDFGLTESGEPVSTAVVARLGPSLELAMAASLLGIPVAILGAVYVSRRTGKLSARLSNGLAGVGFTAPTFWVGILLVLLFGVWLDVLPASGYVAVRDDLGAHLRRLALPTLTLAIPQTVLYFRYLQESLGGVLRGSFVRTARAKGLSERTVMFRHALPAALLPAMTIFGVSLASMIGGVVVVERVFSWPGIGSLLLYSVSRQDFNTVSGIVLATAASYVVLSTLVDVGYRFADPRQRRS